MASPVLVSASRRTDIPRYFARWFAERRRAGFAQWRNAFGGQGVVSLAPSDVLGYLFWTRDARRFSKPLRALREEGVPFAFQFTLTGLGRDLEPHAPDIAAVIDHFRELSAALPSPTCIQWRYDPVVWSDRTPASFHRDTFARLAGALRGATAVVNTSIVEPFAKTVRRVRDTTVRYRALDPERHATTMLRNPSLPAAGDEGTALLRDLAVIARAHDMELRGCCDPESGLPPSQCCGPDLFAAYGEAFAGRLASKAPSPTRPGCRCLPTVDIGMDNSCLAGCLYCYAVQSQEAAVAAFRRHDPSAPRLR